MIDDLATLHLATDGWLTVRRRGAIVQMKLTPEQLVLLALDAMVLAVKFGASTEEKFIDFVEKMLAADGPALDARGDGH